MRVHDERPHAIEESGPGRAALRLTLPYPPSGNDRWNAVSGRYVESREARDYRERVNKQLKCRPLEGALVVSGVIYRPTRRGDLDNRLKTLLDALQGVAYRDDGQIQAYRDLRLDTDPDRPRAELLIEGERWGEPLQPEPSTSRSRTKKPAPKSWAGRASAAYQAPPAGVEQLTWAELVRHATSPEEALWWGLQRLAGLRACEARALRVLHLHPDGELPWLEVVWQAQTWPERFTHRQERSPIKSGSRLTFIGPRLREAIEAAGVRGRAAGMPVVLWTAADERASKARLERASGHVGWGWLRGAWIEDMIDAMAPLEQVARVAGMPLGMLS
jgi:crossover junction endodeoxyribonuclease RusA